ncbi:MAG: twin-arginine translocation signal domain-containing protein, partial [Burkholderiales bacterium]|nr:twin-arginine translocation signal domain-containing protein [Burkholderiales bacterium]
MKTGNIANPSRRKFIQGAAATAGSLVVAFHIPFTKDAEAQTLTDEINAWVVVKPNDTVIVRIARSEMGQGSLT